MNHIWMHLSCVFCPFDFIVQSCTLYGINDSLVDADNANEQNIFLTILLLTSNSIRLQLETFFSHMNSICGAQSLRHFMTMIFEMDSMGFWTKIIFNCDFQPRFVLFHIAKFLYHHFIPSTISSIESTLNLFEKWRKNPNWYKQTFYLKKIDIRWCGSNNIDNFHTGSVFFKMKTVFSSFSQTRHFEKFTSFHP